MRRAGPVVIVVSGVVAVAALAAGFMVLNRGVGGERGGPEVLGEVPVTANDLRAPRAQNSPVLAADPTDPRFVALANRLDAPDFSCALQISGDGGRSWVPADPVPELPEGAEKCFAPRVAFDRDGTLYYLFVGLHGPGNSPMGVFLTTSDDRAGSFSPPRRLLGAQRYQVRMAIDPAVGDAGRLHLVWLETSSPPPTGGLPAPPNPLLAAHSDDGGESFSDPVQVNDPDRPRSVAPALALGPGGAVHVLYYDLGEDVRDYRGLEGSRWEAGKWSLVLASSRDGGRSFSPGVAVDDGLVSPERVMLIYTMPPAALAVDEAGRLFAAWHDARNGDWDVFLRRSPDAGRSWDAPLRLNDDELRNGRHQYLPQLAVSPGGRVDAAFYDRRNDPENIRNDTYFTWSTDGGRTFEPNRKLTSSTSHSRSGQRYLVPSAEGLVEFGQSPDVLSRDEGAVVAWTDTRNARFAPYQDVFATEVSGLPVAGRAISPWAWLGVAVTGLLLVVAVGLRRRDGHELEEAESDARDGRAASVGMESPG